MPQQVLEGTWEEICAHELELAGQHVRLTFFRPERPSQLRPVPPVIYDPSSDSELTDEIRTVLDSFIHFLLKDVRQNAIAASKVEIRGVELPDDGSEHISVRLWMMCDSDEEMWRYLEDFGGRADRWLNSLNPNRKLAFCNNTSFMTWRVKNA